MLNKFIPLFAIAVLLPNLAHAFCGFYVAKADANLFNEASKVILSRADNRTVITMANDYQGELKDFAIVVPVPEVLKEQQINVTENRIIDHIDAYTAPRLVEYFDPDPCQQIMYDRMMSMADGAPRSAQMRTKGTKSAKSLGVTIEAEYTVGEYDIAILSAKQNDGLLTYLNQEGYKLPSGTEKILGSYIKQDMKFFIAKVNLKKQAKSGFSYLRPLQIAFESKKFMLPIRLGTLNANGPQDLILYTLTKKGRVETANYRTTKIPTGMDIPIFVKDEFDDFYKDMFKTAVEKENMKTVFLEYAWDMGWCDPCAADPIANKDLKTLGVWWLDQPQNDYQQKPRLTRKRPSAANVYVTRLHVRYTAETFPEDLILHETADRTNFQGRYVLRHPFTGDASCEAGKTYKQSLPKRFDKEAKTLANLTGRNINDIRKKMDKAGQSTEEITEPENNPTWWEDIWND